MDAAKLALAVLAGGSTEFQKGFIDVMNMVPLPSEADTLLYQEVRARLGLDRSAAFVDFVAALVHLYAEERTGELIFHAPCPDGQLDDFVYDGPSADITISGPLITGQISFVLSRDMCASLVAAGLSEKDVRGVKSIAFVHQLYGWAASAAKETATGETPENYLNAIEALRREHARGVRLARTIGGRELDALGRAFRDADDEMEGHP